MYHTCTGVKEKDVYFDIYIGKKKSELLQSNCFVETGNTLFNDRLVDAEMSEKYRLLF